MNQYKKQNIPETRVFNNSDEQNTFGYLVETLDYVTPIYLDQCEFKNKEWNIIEKTGKSNGSDIYNLYLPKQANYKDIFYIVFLLNEKHNMNSDMKKIIGYIKILLKEMSKNDIETLINEVQSNINTIIDSNQLNPECFEKYLTIINDENPFILRGAIQGIKEHTQISEGGTKNLSVKKIIQGKRVHTLYSQELLSILFKKGIYMLREGLMTFTKMDLIKACIQKGELHSYEEICTQDIDLSLIHREEKLLRDTLKIEEYIKTRASAKKENNKEALEKGELEFCIKLLTLINNQYPFFLVHKEYGYKITDIKKSKRMYCLGFSLLCHGFLEEVGIKHNAMDLSEHSSLEIKIGQRSYSCDPANTSELKEMSWKEESSKKREGKYINYTTKSDKKVKTALSGNPEKILLAQIAFNKSAEIECTFEKFEMLLYDLSLFPQDYQAMNKIGQILGGDRAKKSYNKSLKINPQDKNTYKLFGKLFKKEKNRRLSHLYTFIYNLCQDKVSYIQINSLRHKKEKQELKILFQKSDFNGIREYLLALQTN